MAHNCIDWTVAPPARKVPHLVLTKGDDHVYTIVPNEFKTLEDIARKEFNLGDHADIKIFSSCVNLCNGLPARITESAWERMREYIGCATVELVAPRIVDAQLPDAPQLPDIVADEPDLDAPMNMDTNNEAEHALGTLPGAPAGEPVPHEEGAMSNNPTVHDRPMTPEQHNEPEEEDLGPTSPRKPRHRRLVVSDEENDESERVRTSQGFEREIKKERHSDYHSQAEAEQSDRPIKQEKLDTQAQDDARSQAPAEASENLKLMIRVAHRPTRQESKFTTKSTTKVNKVLTGACKSFGLDASRTTLYLIVSMEDEDGEVVENLFPCDKNDTIARAGAEHTTESRFLLKMAGEA